MRKRTRKYINMTVSKENHKAIGNGKVVLFRLPGGTMMSMALKNNIKWRNYVRANDKLDKAKLALKIA